MTLGVLKRHAFFKLICICRHACRFSPEKILNRNRKIRMRNFVVRASRARFEAARQLVFALRAAFKEFYFFIDAKLLRLVIAQLEM